MEFLATALQRCLARKTVEQQLSRTIELENGEAINIRGFKVRRNKIHTSWSHSIWLYFFRRTANLYLLIVNLLFIAITGSIDASQPNYFTSLIFTLSIYAVKEAYFLSLKRRENEIINSRQVTILSKLKKTFGQQQQNKFTSQRTISKKETKIEDYEKQINSKSVRKDLPVELFSRKQSSEQSIKKRMSVPRIDIKVPVFQNVRWDQLEIGDIVFMKFNEISPADLLILEMCNFNSVASSAVMSGNTNEIRKKPCSLTTMSKEHKKIINQLDYRRVLNGVIRYESDSQNYFKGTVKMKKDPQQVEILKENILFREQQMRNVQHLYGLVLEVGTNCRCYRGIQNYNKFGFFEQKANSYFLVAFIMVIAFTIIAFAMQLSGVCIQSNFILRQDNNEFMVLLLQFSNLLPIYLYFFLDSIQMVYTWYNNYKFLNYDQNSNSIIQDKSFKDTNECDYLVMNPSQIGDLGMINHCLIDKTGTITNGKFKISCLFIYDTLFNLNWKKMLNIEFQEHISRAKQINMMDMPISEKNEDSPEKKPVEKSDEDANFIDLDDDHPPHDDYYRTPQPKPFLKYETQGSSQVELSHQSLEHKVYRLSGIELLKRDRRGSSKLQMPRTSNLEIVSEVEHGSDEHELIQRWRDDEFRPHLMEALYSMCICHNTRTTYNKNDDSFIYEYPSELDELQIELARIYGFNFLCNQNTEQIRYLIQEQKLQVIDIMAVHQFNSRRLSVICRIPDEWYTLYDLSQLSEDIEFIQYLRDDGLEMVGCLGLDKDQAIKLDGMIHEIQANGSRPILFYRSFMNESQCNLFITEANKVIHKDKVELGQEYQFLMHEFQRSCDLVQIIGIKEKVKGRQSIDLLNQMNIPCWMVSGDTFEKVIPVAYKTNLLLPTDQFVHIQGKTYDELFIIIKQQLQGISSQLKQKMGQLQQQFGKKDSSLNSKRRSQSLRGGFLSSNSPAIMVNNHIKYTQYVIHGTSLEIINNDPYLKKHFQFLLQFTSYFVGYQMTPFQKHILLKLIRDRRLQYKNILAIGDSYSDICAFNSADFAIQISSRRPNKHVEERFLEAVERRTRHKFHEFHNPLTISHEYNHVEVLPNSNMLLRSLQSFQSMILIDNKYHAEFFDNVLAFAFFRSFSIISLLMVFYCFDCNQNRSLISPDLLQYHTGVLFLPTIMTMAYRVYSIRHNEQIHYQLQIIQFRLNQKQFRQSKLLKFVVRICLLPIIQSLAIIGILIVVLHSNSNDVDGKELQFEAVGSGMFLIQILIELLKIYQRSYLSMPQTMITVVIIYGCYLLVNLQLSDFMVYDDQTFSYWQHMQMLFLLILIFLFHAVMNMVTVIYFDAFLQAKGLVSEEELMSVRQMESNLKIIMRRQQKKHKSTINKISMITRRLFKKEDDVDGIIKQMISGVSLDISSKIRWWSMSFQSETLEHKFFVDNQGLLISTFRIIIILTLFIYDLSQLLIIHKDADDWSDYISIAQVCVVGFMGIFSLTKRYYQWFYYVNGSILLIRVLSIIVTLFETQRNVLMLYAQLSLIIGICMDQKYPTVSIFAGLVITVIFIITNSGTTNYESINQCLIVAFTFFIITFSFYRIITIFREVFKNKLIMIKENTLMSDVLGILLPKFIIDRINKEGQFDIQEDQGSVAVLFCDICDFDKLIKSEQRNIVHILDKLFRHFDNLCQQHGVQKIETVGKTYMAAAGLRFDRKLNSVNKVIQLAIDMKKYVTQEHLKIKIGIHYGPVIAGVIGHHKPQFSLIGDTINTTSRVCSTSETGDIAISEQAFLQTNKSELQFTPRQVEAKGKGIINTFVVSQKRHTRTRKATVRLPKQHNYMFQLQDTHKKIEASIHIDSLRDIGEQESAHKQFRKEMAGKVQQFKRPTVILPSIMSQSQIERQSKFSYDDNMPNDLIQALEWKTRCELNVSETHICKDYEIEQDKVKALFEVVEEVQSNSLLLDPKSLYLRFQENNPDKIDDFYSQIRELYQPYSVWLVLLQGLFLIVVGISYAINDQIANSIVGIIFGNLIIVFSQLIRRHKDNSDYYFTQNKFIIMTLIIFGIYTLDCFTTVGSQEAEIQIGKGIFYCFALNINRAIRNQAKIILNLVYIIITVIALGVNHWDAIYLFYVFSTILCGMAIQLFMFYKNVSAYNVSVQLYEKQQQQSNLLLYLLPQHILEQFFTSENVVLVEEFSDVTLLFADIAGFTEYSSKVQPEQVVNMLRNLFTEFDKVCLGNNVYKLYTIGDCYVVMGLVDGESGQIRKPAEEAANVVRMGFYMIDVIRRVRAIVNVQSLDMRIGVHTGNIIGGVLGTELVRYDIYGPDVLIANKMESKGVKGFVQVSQETKDLIESEYPEMFRYELQSSIEIESISRKTNGYLVSQTDREVSIHLQQ